MLPLPNAPRLGSARALNPEAGDHAVTADPTELAAAERAIRRSWAEFPYYGRRYAARGRAFSASDSGWLVALCSQPEAAAVSQVLWLATVLASRGMPRWLLERHLEQLAEELDAARPEGQPRHAVLRAAAAVLRARRVAHVSEATLRRCEASFDARVPAGERRGLKRTGGMLAAAVADERDGLAQAVPSLVAWLTDPARFSPDWVAAVLDTLAEARSADADVAPA